MINRYSISKKAKTLTSSSCVKLSSSARSGPTSPCDSESVPWHDHASEGWGNPVFLDFLGSQAAKKGHFTQNNGSKSSVSMMVKEWTFNDAWLKNGCMMPK